MRKLRWSFHPDCGLYRPRGFGVWTRGGCLGTTCGETGRDMFREFTVLIFKWEVTLSFSWKNDDEV